VHQLFIDLARSPNACVVPRTPVWIAYGDELRVAADRVLALQVTPEQALRDTQRQVQPKLDRLCQRWDLVKDDAWRVEATVIPKASAFCDRPANVLE